MISFKPLKIWAVFLGLALPLCALADTVTVSGCRGWFAKLGSESSFLMEIKFSALKTSDHFSGQLQPQGGLLGLYKSKVIWNPLSRKLVRAQLFHEGATEEIAAAEALKKVLQPGHEYNFIVADNKLLLAPIGTDQANNLLSKHLMLGDGKPVEFAGLIRREANGNFIVVGDSGSYAPTEEIYPAVRSFFDGIGLENTRVLTRGTAAAMKRPKAAARTAAAALGETLQEWLVKHQRIPRLDAADQEERIAAMIAEGAESIPGIAKYVTGEIPKIAPVEHVNYGTVSLQPRFVGENNNKVLWSDTKQKMVTFNVKYYHTPEEQKAITLFVDSKGRLIDHEGKLFDSRDAALKGMSNSEGRAMIAMTKDCRLTFGKEQLMGKYHHSSILDGKETPFAGEIIAEHGVLKFVKNLSGHYLTPPEFTAQILHCLRTRKVDLSQATWEVQ